MGKASSQKQSRREMIEKMQREQAVSDRRRTILIVVCSIVIGLAIIAYPAIKLIQDSRSKNQPMAEIGVAAASASCDAITTDPGAGSLNHRPDGEKIAYPVSPPSSGPHYAVWAPFAKKFYTMSDRPAVENLVHNLEHGYAIMWYRDTLPQAQIDQIERISTAKLPSGSAGKFIAAPFKQSELKGWPDGKNIAFARWSAPDPSDKSFGHRQFCGSVSGAALQQFMEKYPASDSPEPNAG